MVSDKRILFTTACIDGANGHFDWVGTNVKWKYRFSRPRKISYALRFLKQNLPEIEILEYPTWEQYEHVLDQHWDIVGFSFYLNDVHKIDRMIAMAREKNVAELWGGNYGVLTDGMEKKLDRIFLGYAEHEIAKYLNKKIEEIIHPPIINILELGSLNLMRFGVLFTTRGCTHSCKFCQTPKFEPNSDIIPLASLERVIKYYKSVGLNMVGIFDENFGLRRGHATEVVKLLDKYKMYWACMARAEFVAKQLKTWKSNGGRFVGAGVGIESFNSEILSDMDKKFDEQKILSDLKTIKENNIGILGYYMIGFESETEDAIKNGIKKLADLNIDMNQITIVTPLPKTPLWYQLESKFGIFETDYTKYDTKHLVWQHPNISKARMEQILDWGLKYSNPRSSVVKLIYRFQRLLYESEGVGSFSMIPRSLYLSKKFNPDGYKIFFDGNGELVKYKFDFN